MFRNFKSRVAEQQKNFIANKDISFKEYCILKNEDALQNQLFQWPGIIEGIQKLKKKKLTSKDGLVKNIFKNMLRSEHIPYNLFMPLYLSHDQEKVLLLYRHLLKRDDLKKITKFYIEWAPKPIQAYLHDNTSFDTYVEFILAYNKKLGVGIEVKFTEKSYPFTQTERIRLETENDTSLYYKAWGNGGTSFYKNDTYKELGKKEQKQFFRNHLLGISMINSSDIALKIDEFISVHLFPSGNTYQYEKSNVYSNTLKDDKKQYFKAITFESFIAEAGDVFKTEPHISWLTYLKQRYIVL